MDPQWIENDRLQKIEARLTRIENHFNLPPIKTIQERPEAVTLKKEKTQPAIKSGNWLGIISIICFVLAAGFIVKLSIDSGWLTPAKQIIIATILGLGLIGVGVKLLKIDRKYMGLLPAGGIIILYLTAFSAYRLYHFLYFESTIILIGVISLLCIGLYFKIREDIYPLIAVIGAYLTPIFFGLEINSSFTLYYYVICSLTFSTISIWVESRLLTMISAYLAILVTAAVGLVLNENTFVATIIASHFFIFTLGTFLYTQLVKKPLTEAESWSFFPVLLLFYCSEYYYIYLIQPNLAAWISLIFAAFLVGLYLIAKRFSERPIISQTMIMTFFAIVFFHSGYFELLPLSFKPWLLVIMIFGFAFLPIKQFKNKNSLLGYLPIGLLFLTIIAIEYARMAFTLFSNDPISWPVVLLSIAGMWLFYIYQQTLLQRDEGYGYSLLGVAHFLVILALYRLADPHGSLAVSISWLIYAIAIMGFAFLRKDKIMANSALPVLFLAAGKALLYDAASAPTIIRILCLLLTGIVLYGSGYLFRKISKW